MKWITPTGYYWPKGAKERVPFRQTNCAQSEDGRFIISRAPAEGFVRPGGTITYTLAERPAGQGFAPVTPPDTRIVAVERDVPNTHDDRLAAIARLKALTGDIGE